jgi:hypothetical protein
MALAAPVTPLSVKPSWNPLKFSGTELPTELTIMVKVLAAVVLLTNHVRLLPDPWLPFVPGIDRLPPVLFQRSLQTAFVVSALALLFNRRVRLASLVLGSIMLIAVVSSKAYYGNNKTFCGLMFFLVGLHVPRRKLWPLQWQLGITYFGAGLNKLFDGDWHSGVFFQNWALQRLHQPWYIALDSMLPQMVLARLMCWTTIVTELGIVPATFVPQLHYWAVCVNILFQSGLLLFTGTTFTLFFYGMTAASLAFVTWPSGPVPVLYDGDHARLDRARRFFARCDLDGLFQWSPQRRTVGAAGNWLHLSAGNKIYTNFPALRMIVLLNPLTWLTIAGLLAAAPEMSATAIYRRGLVGSCLFLLMPPLAWLADKIFSRGKPQAARIAATGVRDRTTQI